MPDWLHLFLAGLIAFPAGNGKTNDKRRQNERLIGDDKREKGKNRSTENIGELFAGW